VVGPEEAPVLLATVVVIIATLAQVAYLKARGMKVDLMLWVSLTLVVVLGGLTVVVPQRDLHQMETQRAVLGDGPRTVGEPGVVRQEPVAGAARRATEAARPRCGIGSTSRGSRSSRRWDCSTCGWPTASPLRTWVNFKLFGALGLMLAFTVAQGLYLSRHMEEDVQQGTRT
jgi:intracellular septation protein